MKTQTSPCQGSSPLWTPEASRNQTCTLPMRISLSDKPAAHDCGDHPMLEMEVLSGREMRQICREK